MREIWVRSLGWEDPLEKGILLPGESHGRKSLVGYSPWGHKESDTTELLHFHFHALEKEIATRSSVLAWRIPGTGEPGGLSSLGSHRVGHDSSDLPAAAAVADRILISRYITLPTKVHTVKPMVFPVVMYRCDSWTIRKAEC